MMTELLGKLPSSWIWSIILLPGSATPLGHLSILLAQISHLDDPAKLSEAYS
jgi:hypothetical protein